MNLREKGYSIDNRMFCTNFMNSLVNIFIYLYFCIFLVGGCTNDASIDNTSIHLKREIPVQNPGGIFFELDEEFVESYNEYLFNRIKEQGKNPVNRSGSDYKRYEFGSITNTDSLDEKRDVYNRDASWRDIVYIDSKGKQYVASEVKNMTDSEDVVEIEDEEDDEEDEELDDIIDGIYNNIAEESVSE